MIIQLSFRDEFEVISLWSKSKSNRLVIKFERELETCFFLSRYRSGGPFFYWWPYLEMHPTLIILQIEKSILDFFPRVEGFYYPPWISSTSMFSAPALVNRDSYIWTSKYDSTYFPRKLEQDPFGQHWQTQMRKRGLLAFLGNANNASAWSLPSNKSYSPD